MINCDVILKKYPREKKFTLPVIAYTYDMKLSKVKKEYKKGIGIIERVVELFHTLEDFEKRATIKISSGQSLFDSIHLVNKLYKMFPLKYFKEYMKIDPRIILYILCTNKRASYLFKLPKEDINKIKTNIEIVEK